MRIYPESITNPLSEYKKMEPFIDERSSDEKRAASKKDRERIKKEDEELELKKEEIMSKYLE